MTSAPPPRRPRPGPRRPLGAPAAATRPRPAAAATPPAPPELPAPPTRGVVVIGDDTIRVPGFAALLHRHPKLTQRSALGAIATGITLFVVAGVTTPLAGANIAKPAARTTPPITAAVPVRPDLPLETTAPAAAKVLDAKPARVKKKAPVGHGVISGLAANGIPNVALNAYRVAAARMGNVSPGCGIDWALLAGIGREESDHGRFAGAVLHADGVSTPAIIGPALDGVHWDYIPAPANGLALDGDAKFAHALGPMQFIPSTWAIYGTDATGDGRADIFNINDAALGAARYLCAAGGNLRTHAGQVRAVLSYNHSDQYLAQVLALADAYRRGIPITGIPLGITSGPLPKVTDTGYIPPANPGAPTAVDKSGKSSPTSKPAPHRSSSAPSRAKTSTAKAAPSTGASSGTKTTAPAPSGSTSTSAPKPTPTSSSPSPTRSCNPLQIFCKP